MVVFLKEDIIAASVVKRLYNFYNNVRQARGVNWSTLSTTKDFPGWYISVEDCMKRQEKAKVSALGIVISDHKEEDFIKFLNKSRFFERSAMYNKYKLSKECISLIESGKVLMVVDELLERAYSQSTLLALDIV